MQLKKTARDDRFGDLPEEYEQTATGLKVPEFESGTTPMSRPMRTRDADFEGETVPAIMPAGGESVLDASSTFDGRYEAGQDLRVLGTVSGELVCRGMLTVERDAVARARIQARDAVLRGRLDGDIVCSGRLVIAATATVTGTLKASALIVEEGASISGMVETSAASIAPPAVAEPPARRSQAASQEKESAPAQPAAAGDAPRQGNGNSRWTQKREVPSFALVSSEEHTSLERN
ncbi:MAG: polymer-forming cytoskeletal protein [Dehalococcoidia bacterium]|nr:polymer-forming cytoskeletal protein [Dehalococcoidia bacterium]